MLESVIQMLRTEYRLVYGKLRQNISTPTSIKWLGRRFSLSQSPDVRNAVRLEVSLLPSCMHVLQTNGIHRKRPRQPVSQSFLHSNRRFRRMPCANPQAKIQIHILYSDASLVFCVAWRYTSCEQISFLTAKTAKKSKRRRCMLADQKRQFFNKAERFILRTCSLSSAIIESDTLHSV